jgi:hypothetical protein
MPPLDRRWFSGTGGLLGDLPAKLEIASLGNPVTHTLSNLGWDGTTPVASIGLELSPDNRHVQRAQFLLRGQLAAEPVSRSAASIWSGADKDVTFRAEIPDGSRFQFSAGGLTSDYLACEEMKIRFSRGDTALLPADWPAAGIAEFAIRCVCYLDKNSNKRQGPLLKYLVMLVPLSVEELRHLEPNSASSAWPGFKLAEGSCRFFPTTDQSTWGDPICPLLCRGSHVSEAPYLPPPEEIRFHIGAVMQTAKLAVPCKTANGWRKQRDKAVEDIASMEKEPLITWPATARHAAPQGTAT